jgi:hypothetical protein
MLYHKIDTGLPPEYYDIDTLMVHGMFSFIVRYVESEKRGEAKCLEEIAYLENNWGEGYDSIPEEMRQGHIDAAKRQADDVREALRIYHWWKDVFPKYDDYDNNPWSKYCDEKNKRTGKTAMDRFFNHIPCEFDDDGDPTMYRLDNNETPEEEAASRVALTLVTNMKRK